MNNPPGESTAAAIPSLLLKTDADSSPFSRAVTTEVFTPIPSPALPLLQELLALNVSCATREVTLRYCTGGGGSVNVASALIALECAPSITLVARRDDPFLLRGNTRRPSSKWAPDLFRMISCFSRTTWNENKLKPKSGTKRYVVKCHQVIGPAVEYQV